MKTDKFIKTICLILILIITLISSPSIYAEDFSSNDLIILQKAMLERIEFDSDWLNTNGDNTFDMRDLIRLKKHLAGMDVEINPIKHIDITFVSGETQKIVRQYTSRCRLPILTSPYLYWKVGNSYYDEGSVITFNSNAVVKAVESKKDVDFPIIDF